MSEWKVPVGIPAPKKPETDAEFGCSVPGVGCLTMIVMFIVIWGLLFGVTVNGKHHGISCSTEKGVVVE